MLREKLEDDIFNRMEENVEVVLIIMHPQTWNELLKEIICKDSPSSINEYDPNIKYRGIEVLRSLDLKENNFRVV